MPPQSGVDVGNDESLAWLFDAKIGLVQARRGHRTAVDALALAWFASRVCSAADLRPHSLVDLGAGSGIVAILVGAVLPELRMTLVETQPRQVDRAQRNATLNGMANRVQVVAHDLAAPLPLALGRFALVVTNPPFRRLGQDQPPQSEERRLAHFESTADLQVWLRRVAESLADPGLAIAIYPWQNRARLSQAAKVAGLHGHVVQMRHSPSDASPTRALMVASRQPLPATLIKMSGFSLHPDGTADSTYTDEIQSFIETMTRSSWAPLSPLSG